ncbi:hypothetical protein [Sphingomonas xinjiangensis]|uniref:Transmembrane protein n=1 Tax=Sphingomonas xinjiangensis TaxID=643568 RepID=A0A840YD19_9SPHN|nr:hypothetical protein [Sphingomonas xinjiangensis]MBB5710185.1 hypothetical protein [Sphingomonas xinjiangensis]
MTDSPDTEQELQAQFEAEDTRLRVQIAGYAGMAVVVLLIALGPLLSGLNIGEGSWRLFVWAIVSLPLLTVTGLAWKRGRFRMASGHVHRGWIVCAAAVLAVALSLGFFCLG